MDKLTRVFNRLVDIMEEEQVFVHVESLAYGGSNVYLADCESREKIDWNDAYYDRCRRKENADVPTSESKT